MADPDLNRVQRKYLADGELACESEQAVDDPLRARLVDALDGLNAVHDWWAEPLRFEPADANGVLRGGANLTLVGYETSGGELIDIGSEEDGFMAFMDLCVAVDWLGAQSEALGVDWRVRFGGQDVGRIIKGQEDEDLEAFLVALGEAVGADFDDRDDERATALDEAHRARR